MLNGSNLYFVLSLHYYIYVHSHTADSTVHNSFMCLIYVFLLLVFSFSLCCSTTYRSGICTKVSSGTVCGQTHSVYWKNLKQRNFESKVFASACTRSMRECAGRHCGETLCSVHVALQIISMLHKPDVSNLHRSEIIEAELQCRE